MDVFISYSHRDRAWKDRVATFMQCMKQHGQFDYATWDDGEINPSENWAQMIRDALARARVAILLVSPDFLSSRFINEVEVPWLLERRGAGELAVVPLIVRPCPWEVVAWLAPIQLHPSDGTALSGGSEHSIEEHLKQLALEVHRLLAQASLAIEAETREAALTEAPLRSDPELAGFEFLDEAGVKDLVHARSRAEALDALLLFQTRTQHTWLVTSRGRLFCILDSEESRDADRLVQWEMRLEPYVPVRVRERSRSAAAGLVDIGKRQNWLYSRALHPDAGELQQRIEALLGKARHA